MTPLHLVAIFSSLWDIIWSCCLTIFTCTWTAVHPNILGMYESKAMKIARRIGIMILAIVAPELMITWAMRQFLSARRTAKQFRWGMTHGFFVWMGGFMLYVNGVQRATLTPDELLQFIHAGLIDMPAITVDEIDDRSKIDALSKWVTILQLVWFVSQLVAHHVQKLLMTLLETETMAVATLTWIYYFLWLKKPKDVGIPYAPCLACILASGIHVGK
ncbi:uncharacterized protein EDB93DRAFT_1243806 [Suillus bovinus]|uniref:uncharacterized protein n=1 Tax=Suillus bovinus TaxID=48563 RepID=UPI001B884F4E|nr:uncharacterized protein EDB93DRAFT_1243806 [Suillus bovinus]KAG2126786.1 hypothetical protein EDB93DRAFT_1243806 [Suillus bovinus]